MNFFAEGLQGSGKSTLVKKLSGLCSGCTVICEGDYSPTELAWCAYMDEQQYLAVLAEYPELRAQIEAQTFSEEAHRIVCYTKIQTDQERFYKDLEQYEIYNGRMPFEEFRSVILRRFANWNGGDMIFECSLFQNIVTDMLLFRNASDAEIMALYRDIRQALSGIEFHIFYLETENVSENLYAVRKERTDENGNEVWFSMLCGYFDASPYAKSHGVSGEQGIIEHLQHRQALELQICREIFPEQYTILKSKKYEDAEIIAAL